MAETPEMIPIITYEAVRVGENRNPDARTMTNRYPENILMGASRTQVSVESLGAKFNELLGLLGKTLTLPQNVGSLIVDGLDVELELTAEGEFGLLGNGGKVGGKGSLTLRLKR